MTSQWTLINVLNRLTKEKESYEEEAAQLEQRLEKMKADGKDIHDIRKQVFCYPSVELCYF